MNAPFPFPWNNRFLDLAHVERIWRKIDPVLPGWFHDATSIYAIYLLIAALMVAGLICAYKTAEKLWYSLLSSGSADKGLAAVLAWDLILAYPLWFIWTTR